MQSLTRDKQALFFIMCTTAACKSSLHATEKKVTQGLPCGASLVRNGSWWVLLGRASKDGGGYLNANCTQIVWSLRSSAAAGP